MNIPIKIDTEQNRTEQNRTEQMVYLKIPVGNNAHEDTQHNIIYKHGSRQCSLSRMCYSFISDQMWRRFYKWICQQVSSYSITT